jgi:hypothetical protein
LDRVRRHPEALAAAEEAVQRYRVLADRNPDVYDGDVAGAQQWLGELVPQRVDDIHADRDPVTWPLQDQKSPPVPKDGGEECMNSIDQTRPHLCGVRSRSGFGSRQAAEQALSDVLSRLAAGVWVDDRNLTLGSWLQTWLRQLEQAGRSPKTLSMYAFPTLDN